MTTKKFFGSNPAWVVAASISIAMGHGSAVAAESSNGNVDTRIERMTDLIAEMAPFGKIMDMLIAADPTWPLQAQASKVSDKQLSCLRGELSSGSLRKQKLAEVKVYAAADPQRFDEDLKLLDMGLPTLLGKMMLAGVDQARTGVKAEPTETLRGATNSQMLSMTMFMLDAKYKGLRDLTGLGEAFAAMGSKDPQKQGAAQNSMKLMMTTFLLKGMDTCGMQISDLMSGAREMGTLPASPPVAPK